MLFSLAANCSLYEQDEQPPQLNIGSEREPRMVSSTEAWREFYARNLLEQYAASVPRLEAARQWAIDQRRSAPASDPNSDRFGRGEWDIAIELCDRAVAMVRGAGAEDDDFARRRLLAAVAHTLRSDTLGAIPGMTAQSARDLVDDLDRIDRQEHDQ